VAVPLLVLVIIYGALRVTGITVREAFDFISARIKTLISGEDAADGFDEEEDDDLYGSVSNDIEDIERGRASSRPSRMSPRLAPRVSSRPARRGPLDAYPADAPEPGGYPIEEGPPEHDTQNLPATSSAPEPKPPKPAATTPAAPAAPETPK